ncbi:MAG: hypothetical protein KDB93_08460 [Flavobacteriales bacterium]|nr:hypothetical protein [Flavobacteriales bacterium]
MTKQAIIERTLSILNNMPRKGADEVLDFANLLLKRHEERTLSQGLSQLSAGSAAMDFLQEEEDLYTLADLKQVYHG